MEAYEYVRGDRLRDDIETVASFSRSDGEERERSALTGTQSNREAREYFVRRLHDIGLSVDIDAVGNIKGRWVPDGVDPTAPAVAAGSHLDSVVQGGIFDGVLGVFAAVEAVRAMQEAELRLHRPIEVVSFTEEEGSSFSAGLLGSSVAVGDRSVDDALGLTDANGLSLESELERIGFRGDGRLDASAWDAWLEVHVEQGKRLESSGVPVGIVTDIAGTTRCRIVVQGEANHAGTTSMNERTDALVASSEIVLALERIARSILDEASRSVVGTIGQFDVEPNAINVIPGRVECWMDVRDVDTRVIRRIVDEVRARLEEIERERGVTTTVECPYSVAPISLSDRCQTVLHEAVHTVGAASIDLHSGAGHDTMKVATVTDAGMIFAPSRNGISHSPGEFTDFSDCATVTEVLTEGLVSLAMN